MEFIEKDTNNNSGNSIINNNVKIYDHAGILQTDFINKKRDATDNVEQLSRRNIFQNPKSQQIFKGIYKKLTYFLNLYHFPHLIRG